MDGLVYGCVGWLQNVGDVEWVVFMIGQFVSVKVVGDDDWGVEFIVQ